MTKKDFIALADWCRDHPKEFPLWTIESLADWLSMQFPRFKRQRWIDYATGKCGPNGGSL